jgi:hypothetical protein
MSTLTKHYIQPAFLVCVVLLAGGAIGMPTAMKHLQMYLIKVPLPISKSLSLLDDNGLGPYKVVAKSEIENAEVLKSLGTEEYIQWVLQDTEAVADSDTRFCTLFITYYDLPDRVPHVPEECYVGGGYQRVSSDIVEFDLSGEGAAKKIAGKYVVFAGKSRDNWASETAFPVSYLLRVNGRYAADRNSARILLGSSLRKSSYFSKVEFLFFGTELNSRVYPNKERTLAASEKLLKVILPALEEQHWPKETEGGQVVSE